MVAIKDMEIPKNCTRCPCSDDDTRFCRAANEYIPMLGKPDWCPLVEVSEPPMVEVEHDQRAGVTTIKVATRALFEALSDYADKQRKQGELLKEAMREAMPKVGYAKTHTNPEDSYREDFKVGGR